MIYISNNKLNMKIRRFTICLILKNEMKQIIVQPNTTSYTNQTRRLIISNRSTKIYKTIPKAQNSSFFIYHFCTILPFNVLNRFSTNILRQRCLVEISLLSGFYNIHWLQNYSYSHNKKHNKYTSNYPRCRSREKLVHTKNDYKIILII